MMQFIMSHSNNSAEKFSLAAEKEAKKGEKQGTWAAAHCVNHVTCVLYYPLQKNNECDTWYDTLTSLFHNKQQQKHRIIENMKQTQNCRYVNNLKNIAQWMFITTFDYKFGGAPE